MANLSTNYMGLELKNPIIVGSSGLTKSVERIKVLEKNGAAAVVLKSLFEEQITHESNRLINNMDSYFNYPEAEDYIRNITKSHSVEDYLNLIRIAKQEVKIPIIASINCYTPKEWITIAKEIESAGADGLEINIFFLPYNIDLDGTTYERMYFEIAEKIKGNVSIPIALKIGYYFSGVVNTIQRLSWTGIDSLVMFNRFFNPDINISTMKPHVSSMFSSPHEFSITLRWIALLSDNVKCNISATTGIHDAETVVKMLLVGATTTQICSTIYLNGNEQIGIILDGLTHWMDKNNFNSIDDFRGKMRIKKSDNPVLFHRTQYMKHLFETE